MSITSRTENDVDLGVTWLCGLMAHVRVVLRGNVVISGNWCSNNLSRSCFQSQEKSCCQLSALSSVHVSWLRCHRMLSVSSNEVIIVIVFRKKYSWAICSHEISCLLCCIQVVLVVRVLIVVALYNVRWKEDSSIICSLQWVVVTSYQTSQFSLLGLKS